MAATNVGTRHRVRTAPRTAALPSSFGRWVVGSAAGAVLVRAWSTASYVAAGGFSPFGGDGLVYHLNGLALSQGSWFVDALTPGRPDDAMHPPLWTLLIGGLSRAGLDAGRLQVATAAIGVLTVVLVALLARRIAGDRAGIGAAVIAAVNPGFWVYERNLNAETLVFPLVTLVLLLAYRFRDRPSIALAAALGAVAGLLAMTRAEQVALVVLVVLPIIAGTRTLSPRRRVACGAAAVAALLVVLTPWTAFNLGRYEHPVLLSAGSGTAMIVGACDATFYGDDLGGYQVGCLLGSKGQYELDDTVRSSVQQHEALRYTAANLGRLPLVVAARIGRSFGLYGAAQQVDLDASALRAAPPLGWLRIVTGWVLLAAAVAGAVVLRRRRTLLYPLLACPFVVVASSVVTFGDTRYGASAQVTLVVLAAVAFAELVDLARSRTAAGSRGPLGRSSPRAGQGPPASAHGTLGA